MNQTHIRLNSFRLLECQFIYVGLSINLSICYVYALVRPLSSFYIIVAHVAPITFT